MTFSGFVLYKHFVTNKDIYRTVFAATIYPRWIDSAHSSAFPFNFHIVGNLKFFVTINEINFIHSRLTVIFYYMMTVNRTNSL